jgi:Ca2+-binding RTX toxin-like protein
VVYAQAGADDIQVAGSIALPAWLFGGDGGDRLKGGAGHDVLPGESGNDLVVGGQGRDLLVGAVRIINP